MAFSNPEITLNNTQSRAIDNEAVFPDTLGAIHRRDQRRHFRRYPVSQRHVRTPYSGSIPSRWRPGKGKRPGGHVILHWGATEVQLYGIRDLNLPFGTNDVRTINDVSGIRRSTPTPVYTGTRPDPRYGGVYMTDNGVTSSSPQWAGHQKNPPSAFRAGSRQSALTPGPM